MLKVSLFLHVLAAIFWIGGMLFLTLVIAPFLRTLDDPRKKSEIYQIVGKKFRFWGWIAIAVLVVTGPINLHRLGVTPEVLMDPAFHSTPYGRAVLTKILFVALIVLSSALHDFWLGPKARNSRRFSRFAMILGRSNLFIALVIVALAVLIRVGGL